MRNLHRAYFKDYFDNLDFHYLLEKDSDGPSTKIAVRNAALTGPNLLAEMPELYLVNQKIRLRISYPGLVTGIGIDHEVKIKGEFKLGVHFDWTRGMPVVYGSSVKGVLKSAFKDGYVDTDLVNKANEMVNDTEKVPEWVGDKVNWKVIIRNIFEGKDIQGNSLSIYNRDVFFDAVITHPDSKGRILCPDSITPHGDNPLKNPIPLTFMKIAPDCTLEFRFKLTNSDLGGGKIISASQKKTLFEEILKTVGIGAKTNVGYGQLKEVK